MKVRIVDESGLTRPYISKKAMLKIVAQKDKYIADRDYKIKTARHDAEQWLHLAEEEKIMLIALEKRLERQVKLTYMLSAASAVIGSLVGFILNG